MSLMRILIAFCLVPDVCGPYNSSALTHTVLHYHSCCLMMNVSSIQEMKAHSSATYWII